MSTQGQAGITADVPEHSRYLTFQLIPGAADAIQPALIELASRVDGVNVVMGLGKSLLDALGTTIEGLNDFPSYSTQDVTIPATPSALWIWLRGSDRGVLLQKSRRFIDKLKFAFELESSTDAFKFAGGKDLTGYEDGTENPKGEEAITTAYASTPEGASFVAVQKWHHNLSHFESLPKMERDHVIGREQSSNEEIDDAPESAHVKRTEQESFSPEAFLLRRSMPWAEGQEAGLMFVAFTATLRPFEVMLARMAGEEDGISDALFSFSKPSTGAYFWCPPVKDGSIDLSCLSA